jgi:hypothetical protein
VQGDSLESFTERMRRGDRAAVAEFLAAPGPAIRARVRHKLGRRVRRVFDSEDILSTVSRRLDGLVADRRLEASEARQMWALIQSIARHATWEKVQGERADRSGDRGGGDVGGQQRGRLDRPARGERGDARASGGVGDGPDGPDGPGDFDPLVPWMLGRADSHGP